MVVKRMINDEDAKRAAALPFGLFVPSPPSGLDPENSNRLKDSLRFGVFYHIKMIFQLMVYQFIFTICHRPWFRGSSWQNIEMFESNMILIHFMMFIISSTTFWRTICREAIWSGNASECPGFCWLVVFCRALLQENHNHHNDDVVWKR